MMKAGGRCAVVEGDQVRGGRGSREGVEMDSVFVRGTDGLDRTECVCVCVCGCVCVCVCVHVLHP